MRESETELPTSWERSKLHKIAHILYGKELPKKELIPEGYPVFGANGIIGYYNAYHWEDEQVLISCRGANSGKINLSPKKCYVTNNSLVLDFFGELQKSRKYFYYYLQTISKTNLVTGTAQPQVTINNANEIDLLIPPLPEQHRIVEKIETLFSELDSGVESLKAAKAQLKRYRQSVLKHAFEGKLTEQWRAVHANELESAESLLKRIKTEREAAYEKKLDEWTEAVKAWEANGKEGKKPAKPKKLKEVPPFSEEELAFLSSLPRLWNWSKLSDVFWDSPQNGLYKPASEYGHGVKIIRIDDFYEGELVKKNDFKRVKLTEDEISTFKVEESAILINRVNSLDYLGKCCFVNGLIEPTVFESNIMKIVVSEAVLPEYITMFLTSVLGTKLIRANAKHAVNQASINQTDVANTPFPLCTIDEQHQIVNEIESRLSEADVMEKAIDESLLKAERLRQSILKKAFEGKLVPQDENDEPASELLKRIKEDRHYA